MSSKYPYSYISCPCSEASRRPERPNRYSRDISIDGKDQCDEEETFNPHHPRSNFSLFPLEHLLYCEECHDIKCPRCVSEEIICWFCPNCLFEAPASIVRSEGNRCARNCFNCPICTAILTTSPIPDGKDTYYILNCNYCMWTTLEIGIKFDKPTNIRGQLDKIANGGNPKLPSRPDASEPPRKSSLAREPFSPSATSPSEQDPLDSIEDQDSKILDPHVRFSALRAFYKDQLAQSATSDSTFPSGSFDIANYSSPSSLTRIMNLYANPSSTSASASAAATFLKRSRQKPQPMREALNASEGLLLPPPFSSSQRPENPPEFQLTTTPSQQLSQNTGFGLGSPTARTVSDLRPIPTLLRTKRAKRCLTCKHILTKPESKPTSTRYRIRLLAANYLPLISLRPLPPATDSKSTRQTDPRPEITLTPGQASQWILRMQNPLFERVKVSLGCPATLPAKRDPPPHPRRGKGAGGKKRTTRAAHRVTILCPQFEIGANSDVWDDALNPVSSAAKPGSVADPSAGAGTGARGGEQIAGKIYEHGRNWTGVVIEIVPGLEIPPGAEAGEQPPAENGVDFGDDDDDDDDDKDEDGDEDGKGDRDGAGGEQHGGVQREEEEEEEGEGEEEGEIIELPIRVRLEWRVSEDALDKSGGGGGDATTAKTVGGKPSASEKLLRGGGGGGEAREGEEEEVVDPRRREVSYWMVVGVGRVG